MQTLEVKKGAPNHLPLNLKGTKWGTSGQFILLFTDNKSLCFYVLSLVFHNLFERRWEINVDKWWSARSDVLNEAIMVKEKT